MSLSVLESTLLLTKKILFTQDFAISHYVLATLKINIKLNLIFFILKKPRNWYRLSVYSFILTDAVQHSPQDSGPSGPRVLGSSGPWVPGPRVPGPVFRVS